MDSGGGLFGYSAAAKGGFSKSDSDALATSEQSKQRTMNITYNVSRATPLSISELTSEHSFREWFCIWITTPWS
jgi:hypothetical protein